MRNKILTLLLLGAATMVSAQDSGPQQASQEPGQAAGEAKAERESAEQRPVEQSREREPPEEFRPSEEVMADTTLTLPSDI